MNTTDPAPGTGTTFTPGAEDKKPEKLTPQSFEAGIQQPENPNSPKGVYIRQISEDDAVADLEEIGVDDWVVKHYNQGDFNIQSMANVLRESTEDIYNRLHAAGISLPDGTYSK